MCCEDKNLSASPETSVTSEIDTMSALLQPITTSSGLRLRNRIAMASMTRNRCVHDHKPGPAQAQHYADRARHGPGLIISEGILVDWAGVDYPDAPFLITKEHAEAWTPVVDAVHKEGALMYFQAWHAGQESSGLYKSSLLTPGCRTSPE